MDDALDTTIWTVCWLRGFVYRGSVAIRLMKAMAVMTSIGLGTSAINSKSRIPVVNFGQNESYEERNAIGI